MKYVLIALVFLSSYVAVGVGCSAGTNLLDLQQNYKELNDKVVKLQTTFDRDVEDIKQKASNSEKISKEVELRISRLEQKIKDLKLPNYSVFTENNRIIFTIEDTPEE